MNGLNLVAGDFGDFMTIVNYTLSIANRGACVPPLLLTHRFTDSPSGSKRVEQQPISQFLNHERYKPLNQLLNRVMREESAIIQAALYKPESYLSRFFSHETWDEWAESRTTLGKVVHLFAGLIEGSSTLKACEEQLTDPILHQATLEANAVLQRCPKENESLPRSCEADVLIGAMGSVLAKSPLPLMMAAASCLSTANGDAKADALSRMRAKKAQALDKVMERKAAGSGISSPSGADGLEISEAQADSCRAQLAAEIGQYLPSTRQQLAGLGSNVLAILKGSFKTVRIVKRIYDIIMIPKRELEMILKEKEKIYWLDMVRPEYVEIFPNPDQAWNFRGQIDDVYEMNVMKEKLKSHGYNLGFGTPLQFLAILKRRGTCERGVCGDD